MSEDLTPEEKALLESATEAPAAARKPRKAPPVETPAPVADRGPVTPAQWLDDDGWGDTPVQMRG